MGASIPWTADCRARAKSLPLSAEPRKPPRLSERKQVARDAAVAVIVDLLGRWRCSQADLAASAELSREAISMAMSKERPFSVEAILLLPDANALEAFDALRDIVKERQRAGRVGHAVKLGRHSEAR